MLYVICILLIIVGMVLSSIGITLPFYLNENMIIINFVMDIIGMILIVIGSVVLSSRISSTGVGALLSLPRPDRIILIHKFVRGKDPDAKIIQGKRLSQEYIRYKNHLFKDIGGGFRIGGHSCRLSFETIGFTIPDWLIDYMNKMREKYNIKNSAEYLDFIERLKKIDKNKNLEQQLRDIPNLKPLLDDPEKRNYLLSLSYDDLMKLEELCIDGKTHNIEDVSNIFINVMTPVEMDAQARTEYLRLLETTRNYRSAMTSDYFKYIFWLFMGIFIMVIVIIALKAL